VQFYRKSVFAQKTASFAKVAGHKENASRRPALHTTSLQNRRNSQMVHLPRLRGGGGMRSWSAMSAMASTARRTRSRISVVRSTCLARRAGIR